LAAVLPELVCFRHHMISSEEDKYDALSDKLKCHLPKCWKIAYLSDLARSQRVWEWVCAERPL